MTIRLVKHAMADFDKRVAEVKAKIGSKADTKVSVARFSAAQVRSYQKQTFSGILLNDLGFARPESQDKDAFIEQMSKETIPSMYGDVLFYFVTEKPGMTDAAKVVEEWMNDSLFKKLEITISGRELTPLFIVIPYMLVGWVLALLIAGTLNVMAFDDDSARGLGQRMMLLRGVSVLAVVLLAGSSVAVAGLVLS